MPSFSIPKSQANPCPEPLSRDQPRFFTHSIRRRPNKKFCLWVPGGTRRARGSEIKKPDSWGQVGPPTSGFAAVSTGKIPLTPQTGRSISSPMITLTTNRASYSFCSRCRARLVEFEADSGKVYGRCPNYHSASHADHDFCLLRDRRSAEDLIKEALRIFGGYADVRPRVSCRSSSVSWLYRRAGRKNRRSARRNHAILVVTATRP
jgi:hypothetical protein